MRLLICYTPSYGDHVNGDHLHDADVKNDDHANVSDNTDTCADAQYRDGRGMVDDTVQQTGHSYIHCAASAHSYHHIGYNRVSCNTVDSLHSCGYSANRCYARVHDHDHDLGVVVSNQNEYSNSHFLHLHSRV